MVIIAGMVGIVIGLLLNPIKTKIQEKIIEIQNLPDGEAQFFEPIGLKEKFYKANNIDDIL